jgi:hypothetical protein
MLAMTFTTMVAITTTTTTTTMITCTISTNIVSITTICSGRGGWCASTTIIRYTTTIIYKDIIKLEQSTMSSMFELFLSYRMHHVVSAVLNIFLVLVCVDELVYPRYSDHDRIFEWEIIII